MVRQPDRLPSPRRLRVRTLPKESKVAHWQEYSACIGEQEISSIVFQQLDEPNLQQIITFLEKNKKLLASVNKIEVIRCSFGKSSNERFFKLIKPSIKSIIFKNTRFVDDGAVICSKLLKISTLEEIAFLVVDLRGHAVSHLCKLLLKEPAMIHLRLIRGISKEYCQQLVETMKICSNLKSLKIDNVKHALHDTIPAIAANTSLTKLILSGNDIGYNLVDLEKVNPKTNLVELQLRDFTWMDAKSSKFLEAIEGYFNLTKLVINNVKQQHLSNQFARSLYKLTKLKTLDITNFYLTEPLTEALQSNTTITDLTCERGTFFKLTASKCQSVNFLSVNLRSLSLFAYNGVNTAFQPGNLGQAVMTGNLTKLHLHTMVGVDMQTLVEGLNSENCHVNELDIVTALSLETMTDLANGLKNNTKLKKLSFRNASLSDPKISAICNMLLVNKHIQSLTLTESPSRVVELHQFKIIVEVLKVNKTLLYLEMSLAASLSVNSCIELVVNELIPINTTLLYFKPWSSDYRIDLWLRRNIQQRGVITIILSNILRTGSVLPLEIWLKIFEFYNVELATQLISK